MLVDKFYDWLNGDFVSKDIPPSLVLSNLLPTWQSFKVKRGFGRKAQASFLMHFLSIRGNSTLRKENPEVLQIMMRLYKESDTMGSEKLHLVAKVLYERTKEGLQLHRAMGDLFSSSFTMIMKAAASKSMSKADDAQERLNKAIQTATEDAIQVASVQSWVRIKMFAAIAFCWASMKGAHYGSVHYQNLKAENPDIDRFIEIPHKLYYMGNLVNDYALLAFVIFLSLAITVRWLCHNWMGEARSELDNIIPSFVIYKYISGLNIFSGLTLLISYVQYETIDAINSLYPSASKYEKRHLLLMKKMLSEGRKGTEQLDTGLLPKSLKLTLKIAGEGSQSSMRDALQLVNTEGKQLIIKALSYSSNLVLFLSIMVSGLALLMVAGASAFLVQAEMGF
ncbi:hypothetical protein AB4455_07925 [Vibrio sp. 10N.261.46.E12]|uniref:hypothetical protein n=1 Tax=unclassified Vibrio TaxID=2614977 RepID=UPI0009762A6B|nr:MULTISPECIES: hypothetical protein [unclassified Vibrio]OMO34469.1 hypothetical protein BH584_12640 [Vibrio sp. 10N.261.45.E1]PMJ26208.1 hypothetical protein BCU27_09645 [Vibrio sp. 10N.286.45.B6]PML82798.1 hypothetical protein BCT66_20120 [Vibrio sp. 10N.261.49.E11]PMM90322.1 hypothetical protein BCT46_23545 [Vibrio sp. 10N.261.46.E8]PMN43942.1 hypothetical protein BCT32_00825 [Vibrio sp. 10N.261.45.E11]